MKAKSEIDFIPGLSCLLRFRQNSTVAWYDRDMNILEHSILLTSKSKPHSGECCINTLLLNSSRWISSVIQCDVYWFITMTRLAASSENCKTENVTHICIQEVTVYHCTLLMLSKQKSAFCCQSNGSAANPIWTALGRHQGTLDTGSLRHAEDEALCFLKKEKSYCQDSLYPTGSSSGCYWNSWKCDYEQGEVIEDGWHRKLEQACTQRWDWN